ncbi:anti-sigma factor family protein [Streptosporangium sandarakinum]|uniref:anti-sigma factor family protein n=1 Tax=Streptosporangium sandarakinum TaxID=1260955 RepID=UPI0034144F52
MTGDTHYDLETLAELAEGLLDAATALQVREHLAICDPCGESLADLAAVREVLAATPTPAMPMGVALRIDRALAAEAESFRGGGVGLVEAPAWDDIMRDAPWETTSSPVPEPVAHLGIVGDDGTVIPVTRPGTAGDGDAPATRPEVAADDRDREFDGEPAVPAARLGVVGDDGTVVPAPVRRRRGSGAARRRWALPAVAGVAAAAVIGATVVSTGMLTASGPEQGGSLALTPSASEPAYQLTDSNWNYTEQELSGSLLEYIGPAQIVDAAQATDASKIDQCVQQVSKKIGKFPFAVDQGFYNGQEANIMVFWQNQAKNTVRVHVVGPQCENVRKPAFARWK